MTESVEQHWQLRKAAITSDKGLVATQHYLASDIGADVLRRGFGPKGIVIGYPDINVMAGIAVARRLYDLTCPLFHADREQFDAFKTGDMITIEEDGQRRRA